jgi:hypothetical protein
MRIWICKKPETVANEDGWWMSNVNEDGHAYVIVKADICAEVSIP